MLLITILPRFGSDARHCFRSIGDSFRPSWGASGRTATYLASMIDGQWWFRRLPATTNHTNRTNKRDSPVPFVGFAPFVVQEEASTDCRAPRHDIDEPDLALAFRSLEPSGFGLVSDFEIRISDLSTERGDVCGKSRETRRRGRAGGSRGNRRGTFPAGERTVAGILPGEELDLGGGTPLRVPVPVVCIQLPAIGGPPPVGSAGEAAHVFGVHAYLNFPGDYHR